MKEGALLISPTALHCFTSSMICGNDHVCGLQVGGDWSKRQQRSKDRMRESLFLPFNPSPNPKMTKIIGVYSSRQHFVNYSTILIYFSADVTASETIGWMYQCSLRLSHSFILYVLPLREPILNARCTMVPYRRVCLLSNPLRFADNPGFPRRRIPRSFRFFSCLLRPFAARCSR